MARCHSEMSTKVTPRVSSINRPDTTMCTIRDITSTGKYSDLPRPHDFRLPSNPSGRKRQLVGGWFLQLPSICMLEYSIRRVLKSLGSSSAPRWAMLTDHSSSKRGERMIPPLLDVFGRQKRDAVRPVRRS